LLKFRPGSALVFCNTRRETEEVADELRSHGMSALALHGDLEQRVRDQVLVRFSNKSVSVLVATDVAARGLQIADVTHVFNFDLPQDPPDYVHRIGRTGRAGKTGHAISYANTDQKGSIRDIERFMKTKMAISALPALPSEKLLLIEAAQSKPGSESTRDERPSRRKPSQDWSSRRRGFKNGGPRKFAAKRIESKQKDFGSKNSNRPESKRKIPMPLNSQPTVFNREDSKDENAFWAQFKKKRPAKKKSVGQGSKRRKGAKRN